MDHEVFIRALPDSNAGQDSNDPDFVRLSNRVMADVEFLTSALHEGSCFFDRFNSWE
jgi:hypothetical protein